MQKPLIIGYDAKRIVRNATGLGSYGRTLINDLSSHQELDLHLYAPDEGRIDLRSQVHITSNLHSHYERAGLSRNVSSLWRTWGIVKDLKHDGIQLYHGLSGELPIGIRKSGIKSVVTIHDLIFLRHPEYYHWLDTKIYAWKFRQTIHEADRIIAISECTKRDIMEFGGVDERKIDLIYQSCSPRFSQMEKVSAKQILKSILPADDLSTRRYILSVGSIEERKNMLLAVKALHYLAEDLSLIIVGRHTPYTDKILSYAKNHGLSHRVWVLHGVSDEQLPALYTLADCFVYPSRYEGFGIPIIEAIHCGLPVVACTGSCLEEAGGPDNLYVSPDDASAMAAAIRQLLPGTEEREERIRRSQEYIRRFNGRDVAAQVINVYRDLLNSSV